MTTLETLKQFAAKIENDFDGVKTMIDTNENEIRYIFNDNQWFQTADTDYEMVSYIVNEFLNK